MYLKGCAATFFLTFLFLSLKENIRKTWKNVFYFTSKAFFALEETKF